MLGPSSVSSCLSFFSSFYPQLFFFSSSFSLILAIFPSLPLYHYISPLPLSLSPLPPLNTSQPQQVFVCTCFGRRKDKLVHRVLVADLNWSDLQTLRALPSVKESELSIVTPSDQQVGVLWVVFKTEHWGGRTQDVLWFVGVLWERRSFEGRG